MSDKLKINEDLNLLNSIVGLIDSARHKVATVVNQELTLLYWHIGKKINEDVLYNERADYGKKIILDLSKQLSEKYGAGFNKRNLHSFIKLNSVIQDLTIAQTLSAQLSWPHLQSAINIENSIKREFYIQMAIHERWSVRTKPRWNYTFYG